MDLQKFKSSQAKLAIQSIANAESFSVDLKMDQPNRDVDPNQTYHEEIFDTSWLRLKSEEYHFYRKEWVEVPKSKRELDFPMHLDIETTNICNLRCPMCPRTILLADNEFSDLGYMSREDYKSIIDQAVSNGAYSIKLNYLGEPLSHPDVVWHVEYAKNAGIVDVLMNSNASLLSKKMSEDLLSAGLDGMFVSFDAVDPGEYEKQRAGTSIGKVIDNVYKFSRLRKEIRPECQLRLSMVMYRDQKWLKQFEALKVMWSEHVDAVGYGYYHDRANVEYPNVPGFYCAQPFQRMFLKYNGNVTICCVDDTDKTIVGDWREMNLRDIWNGDLYKNIRHNHANGSYQKITMCKKCIFPFAK
jgi:MoaA/NifB/PqqE/SkfB family radical SAM enzyme